MSSSISPVGRVPALLTGIDGVGKAAAAALHLPGLVLARTGAQHWCAVRALARSDRGGKTPIVCALNMALGAARYDAFTPAYAELRLSRRIPGRPGLGSTITARVYRLFGTTDNVPHGQEIAPGTAIYAGRATSDAGLDVKALEPATHVQMNRLINHAAPYVSPMTTTHANTRHR